MYPTSAMIIVTYCNSHWFHVSLSWILIHFDSQSTDDIIIIIICNPSLTNDVYIYESTTKAMQRKARRTKYVCSGITQHTNHKSTDNKKVNNVSTLIWFQPLLTVLELSHFWVNIVLLKAPAGVDPRDVGIPEGSCPEEGTWPQRSIWPKVFIPYGNKIHSIYICLHQTKIRLSSIIAPFQFLFLYY